MNLLLAESFWNNWVAVTFLFVGIALLVILVALLIIFRKKIIGSINSKREQGAIRKEEKQKSDASSKILAENVFKKQREEEEARDTRAYDPEFDKRVNKMVSDTQAKNLNERNFNTHTEDPKKESEEEKEEEPTDFNVMDQFKKRED